MFEEGFQAFIRKRASRPQYSGRFSLVYETAKSASRVPGKGWLPGSCCAQNLLPPSPCLPYGFPNPELFEGDKEWSHSALACPVWLAGCALSQVGHVWPALGTARPGRAVQWVHRRVSAVNKAGGLKPRAERGTAFARVALLCRGVLWHFPS